MVRYDGEERHRLATDDAPLDAEGKPKKAIERRDASPREELAISRHLWAKANRSRSAGVHGRAGPPMTNRASAGGW